MKLYRHLTCTLQFVDAVWYAVMADESLIRHIVADESVVLLSVSYPFLQFVARKGGACRIVRIAEIDDVDALAGQFGHKAILCRAGQIDDVRPPSVGTQHACPSAHDIGIDIDGVNRVGDGDAHVRTEQFLEVAGVALGTVADKYLVLTDVDATTSEIVFYDGMAQKVVSLLRSVATERRSVGHLVGRTMQGFYDSRNERLGYVADAEADDLGLRMLRPESLHLLCYLREEIGTG